VSGFEDDYRAALTEAGGHVPFGGCGCSVSYVAFCSEAGTCQLLALDPGD
jgi:hypothetical protein